MTQPNIWAISNHDTVFAYLKKRLGKLVLVMQKICFSFMHGAGESPGGPRQTVAGQHNAQIAFVEKLPDPSTS